MRSTTLFEGVSLGSNPGGSTKREYCNGGELWLAVTQLPFGLVGSNPSAPTEQGSMSERLGDCLQSRLRGFKSLQSLKYKTEKNDKYKYKY